MALPTDGLIVSPAEQAEAILDGRKRLFVKSRPFDIAGEDWLLVSGNVAFGVWRLGDPKKVDADALDKLEAETLISSELREEFWPGRDEFWVYPILSVRRFAKPRSIKPVRGPQVVVRGVVFKAESDLDPVATAELVLAQAVSRDIEKRLAESANDPRAQAAGLLRVATRVVPGFVTRTVRLATGPAGAVRRLRELPRLLAAAGAALRRAGAQPAPVDAPPGAVNILRVLARVLPKAIKAADGAARAALDRALDAVEDVLAFDFANLENTGLLKRGFPAADPEGGVHAHALRRAREVTATDGRHLHVFQIDGRLVATEEDGEHAHVVKQGKDRSARDGAHRHTLTMPDGTAARTEEGDGVHDHDLIVFHTGFDGTHTHRLRLPDGREFRSLTPAEFVALRPDAARVQAEPIDTASEVLKS